MLKITRNDLINVIPLLSVCGSDSRGSAMHDSLARLLLTMAALLDERDIFATVKGCYEDDQRDDLDARNHWTGAGHE